MLMGEVKFLSKDGLETLVNKINEKFVTQTEFNTFKNQITESPGGGNLL